jgi:hypothetical protein
MLTEGSLEMKVMLVKRLRARASSQSGVHVIGFSEDQLRVAERSSERRVMSSSCSQPSPTKE